ncbi:MAG: site-specific DNA-methyltransferase [Cellvibrionales bacterium]|nr:site-specific DNA-methyltransferase [Cellvibrionales bacterium]
MPSLCAAQIEELTQLPAGEPAQGEILIKNGSVRTLDFARFLRTLPDGSVDLILTDPPYSISRKTGFSNVKNGVERFAVSMDFGKWDHQEIDLCCLAELSYTVLRPGGTIIVFYDLWKITPLADALTSAGLKQLRFIQWTKTNPVPLNSKRNYLTNSREVAVLAVKGGKPTFNSEYDNGEYTHPIPRERRQHPTQKPLALMRQLVEKHSRVGDLVVDPFLGSGTTGVAAIETGRRFTGCDKDKEYSAMARARIKHAKSQK